jgi:hypothetical protein
VGMTGLAAHAATASVALPPWALGLAYAGRYLAVAAVLYYAIKALALLLATVVGICTKDKERGQRCVQIVRAVSRGWPWPPRLPGRRNDRMYWPRHELCPRSNGHVLSGP